MADPLSISSGLVGGLSLAIQLCHGTVRYYGKVKGAKRDVMRVHAELDSFDSIIQVLQCASNGRRVQRDVKLQVERLIMSARNGILEGRADLEKFWRENLEGFVASTAEPVAVDKATSNVRNQHFAMMRIKGFGKKSSAALKHRSIQAIDRAKYPFREEILTKLLDFLRRIKADLTTIMPLLSIDVANKTLDSVEAIKSASSQIHEDIQLFREQVENASIESLNHFNVLKEQIESANHDNGENSIQLRDDLISKAEDLDKKMESSYQGIQYIAEKLLTKANEIDAKTVRTGGVVNGGTEKFGLNSDQISGDIKEIKSIGDTFLSKIERAASDIEASLNEMTRTINKNFEKVQAIHENVVPMRDDISDIKQRSQAHDDSAFLDWFSPLTTGFEQKQSESFNTWCKQEEASNQFLQSEDYQQWFEGSGYGLWCLGGPGVGKTILASSIVHQLKQINCQDQALVYIYCDYNDTKNHTTSAFTIKLLAHVARQLATKSPSSSQAFAKLRQRYASSRAPPERLECHDAMLTVAGSFSKIFFVIDGLDECPDVNRDDIFEEFEYLKPKVRLLVTSRCKIGGLFDPQRDICVNIRALDSDIALYVRASTKNFEKFRTKIGDDKPFQEKILNRIVEQANGMFLLAKLHVHALMYVESYYWIEKTLDSLPDGLSPTYDKVIERLEDQSSRLALIAKKLITWVAFAEEPLTVEELKHAIAVEPDDTCLTPTKVLQRATILDLCPELFTLSQNGDILKFVHYSVQEHFSARFGSGQSVLALTCLAYLSFSDFEHKDPSFVGEFIAFSTPDYTLLEYASCNWGHHAKKTSDAKVRQCTLEFLGNTSKVLFSIEVIASKFSRRTKDYFTYQNPYTLFPSHESHDSLRLWMASYFGWYTLVVEFLDKHIEAEYLSYAFRIALSKTYKDLVLLFVQHGVNVNRAGFGSQTALHRAAILNDRPFALELLNQGADFTLEKGPKSQSALHLAAQFGYCQMVQIFLERRHDRSLLTKGDRYGDTILHLAAMSTRVDLVALLIRYGAEVNNVNNGGETPLPVVISNLRKHNTIAVCEIVDLLVSKGALVNTFDHAGQTPLHYAAFKGDIVAVGCLLDYGATIDSSDQLGRTALWFAARSGHAETTTFLIENGAQVNVQDYEKSALWEAVYSKHSEVIEVLLRHGADIHQIGLQGDPILTRLTRYCILDPQVAEQLLKAWANPNIEDRDGLTTLDYASRLSSGALTQILVKYDAQQSGKPPYDLPQIHYRPKASLDALGGPKYRKAKSISLSAQPISDGAIERMCRW